MNTPFKRYWAALFVALTAFGMAAIGMAQVNSGSNGSDGELDFSAITWNTNIFIDLHDHPNGVYQYTYVNIPNVVEVDFIPNANNTPVTWLVQSNVTINGTINVSGQTPNNAVGAAGGPGGGAGGSGGNPPSVGQGPGGGANGNSGVYATPIDGAASIYGNAFILPLLGGSGGSGYGCSGAGGGGGAILIAANQSIALNGRIIASGGNGLDVSSCSASANGSGGAVRLVTKSFSGVGSINAAGGSYFYVRSSSSGRVRIDAFQNTFGGTISADPSAISQGFQPVIIPVAGQGVQLSIASLAGATIAATPTGQVVTPDAIISGQQANPVSIVVNCSNLPLNTLITVTVKPANATSISATGYNTTGTLTSSTATISINMPRGGGIIYATAITGN